MIPESLELTQLETLMSKFLKQVMLGQDEFKPFAIYRSDLDTIVVQTEDCSVTEVQIGQSLVLLERNHLENGQKKYVGFCIEGARYFCRKNELRSEGTISISKILKVMVEIDIVAMPAILDIAIPTLEDFSLDIVEFPFT